MLIIYIIESELWRHITQKNQKIPLSPHILGRRIRKQCVPGSLFPLPPRAWVRGYHWVYHSECDVCLIVLLTCTTPSEFHKHTCRHTCHFLYTSPQLWALATPCFSYPPSTSPSFTTTVRPLKPCHYRKSILRTHFHTTVILRKHICGLNDWGCGGRGVFSRFFAEISPSVTRN